MALFRFAGKARCAGRPGWPFKRRNAVRRAGRVPKRGQIGSYLSRLVLLADR